jgi:hypothetical protein
VADLLKQGPCVTVGGWGPSPAFKYGRPGSMLIIAFWSTWLKIWQPGVCWHTAQFVCRDVAFSVALHCLLCPPMYVQATYHVSGKPRSFPFYPTPLRSADTLQPYCHASYLLVLRPNNMSLGAGTHCFTFL